MRQVRIEEQNYDSHCDYGNVINMYGRSAHPQQMNSTQYLTSISIFTVHNKFTPCKKVNRAIRGVQIYTEPIAKVCGMKLTCCLREANADSPEQCCRIGKLVLNTKN